MFHSYIERKKGKASKFNLLYFPNFEISASHQLEFPSIQCHTQQFQDLISAAAAY